MEFKDYLISAIIIGVFLFAIIGFGVTLSENNNLNDTILQNEPINRSYQNIQTTINDTKVSAEAQRESVLSDIPILGDAGLIFKSLRGVVNVFLTAIGNFFVLFLTLIQDTLGIPYIVTVAFTAIILVSTVLLLWKVIKVGS